MKGDVLERIRISPGRSGTGAWLLVLSGLLLAFSVRPGIRVERLESPGFRARLEASGYRLEGLGWGLKAESWGRSGGLRGIPRHAPSREGDRIRFEHGPLTEWYEARREGIEQGFEIHSRPGGAGPLVVEQAVLGDLEVLKASPDGIVFGRKDRSLLAYRDLRAFDARGRALPARMRMGEGKGGARLSLEVEDAGAEYPVSIDPLSTTADWTAEGNQAAAQFGWQNLGPAGDVNADGYTDVIVGAGLYDNGSSNEGRAYVYHGSAAGLSTTAAWVAESNQGGADYGVYVSTAGDVNGDGYSDVVVGAYLYDNGETNEGRAYAYHGGVNGLSTTAAWVVESNLSSADFGLSVACAGDVNADGFSDVAVSAPLYANGTASEGRVFVYHGSSTGLSTAAAMTWEPNAGSGSFGGTIYGGRSLVSAGDVNGDGFSDLAVGSYGYANGQSGEGRVWLFHGSSGGLGASPALAFEPHVVNTQFGIALGAGDVDGDGYSDLVVGSTTWTNGEANEGRAWVYHGSAAGLSTTAAWATESNQVGGDYGWYVGTGDVNGDGFSDVLAASDAYDNGEADEGRIYVYHGGASGVSTTVAWTAEANQASSGYGAAADCADVNGDGFSDVVAEAFLYANGEATEGRCYVYHAAEGTVTRNIYNLPGTRLSFTPDLGNARLDSPYSRVARDSNGFWYMAWTQGNEAVAGASNQKAIFLSYTTTSTPTAAGDWATVTLVAAGGGGIVSSDNGGEPVIAISSGDDLHFAWQTQGGVGEHYWTKCTSLSALTSNASWVTSVNVITVEGGQGGIDLALDATDVPHVIYWNDNAGELCYSKMNSATTAFDSSLVINGSSSQFPRIAIDLDNNVYVLYQPTAATHNVYLLCSTNAYTTSPANSVWKNLGQTTTDPDTVNSTSTTLDAYTAADLCVDMNNLVHVAWRVAPGNGANSQRIAVRDGRIHVGWTAGPSLLSTPGPWKRPVAMSATGDGNVNLFTIANGGSKRDSVYATTFTGPTVYAADGSWGAATAYSDLAAGASQAIWTERKMWRNRTDAVWFVANDAQHKISTSWTDRATSTAGRRPPTPTKNQTHPHLSWWFPSTARTFSSHSGPPVVAQASKGCVYIAGETDADAFGVYAVDRSRGSLARSVRVSATTSSVTDLTGAAYGGNVHLFLASHYIVGLTDTAAIRKYVDDGNAVVTDTAWSSNPRVLQSSMVDGVSVGPPAFIVQGGVRYLWAMGSQTEYQMFKIKADNGVIAGNYGSTAFSSWSEPPTRILNDQIFFPETSAGLLRREADGSAEIASSAISTQVIHLLQVRGSDNNRLFVAPEDKFVYQLDSGLKTVGWASGRSANLGVTKTSGAYYSRTKDFIYVGAGNQLYRLNAADGSLVSNWPMPATGIIVTLPVQWTTFVYFGMSSGRIFAVNATTNVARANWPVVLDTAGGTQIVTYSAFDAVTNTAYFTTSKWRTYKFNLE